MQTLLLSDLRLALSDLLDNKAATLDSTHSGRAYAPRLTEQRAAIEALPAPTSEARPLVEELSEADAEHDGFAAAIWHYTEAVRRCPGLPEAVRTAGARVRAAFIPKLSIIHRSYATEAAHARDRRPRLPEHAADFDLLPVPGGETLGAWAEQFVDRGETIESLLRARADQKATTVTDAGRREAARLRVETIGLLGRLRSALADELATEPDRLATVDAELFGYFDQLARARAGGKRKGAGGETPAAAVAEAEGIGASSDG